VTLRLCSNGIAIVVLLLTPLVTAARESKPLSRSQQIRIDALTSREVVRGLTGAGPIRSAAGAADTTWLAHFTFDSGGCDAQGWTSHDVSSQPQYFHVDDFADLGGGTHGRLNPLEGDQSLWCGLRPSTDDGVCAYAVLPGYGNNWEQNFCTRSCLTVTGCVTIEYLASWDVEPESDAIYDWATLQFDTCDGEWTPVASDEMYYGAGSAFESYQVCDSLHGGHIRFRFRFTSDGGFSDQDGIIDTDGAIIIDSLTVRDANGVVLATELFEDESVGATEANDWAGCNKPPYGDYAGLFPGVTMVQEEPCNYNATCMWGFFSGSTYNYACAGYPAQPVIPYIDGNGQTMSNEVWSPLIEWTGTGKTAELAFDVYADVPIDPLVFYMWKIRAVRAGCVGFWRNSGYIYWDAVNLGRWVRKTHGFGHYIQPGTTHIQIAVGVVDMCKYWCGLLGSGQCHSHSPVFDNVSAYRVDTTGPHISSGTSEIFNDNFPTDGTLTGTVRADGSWDLTDEEPFVTFNDDAWYGASDNEFGLAADPYTGFGSAVYLYVSVHPQNQPGKDGAALTDDLFRWPVVDSLVHNGEKWYCVRMDTAFWSPDRTDAIPDYFSVDLNDNLFTPGDTVFFFASAQSAAPSLAVNYWSDQTDLTNDFALVAANPSEFTCLPGSGWANGGDILFVSTRLRSYNEYYEDAFAFLGIEDKVDRFDERTACTFGSRIPDLYAQVLPCYRTIIWFSDYTSYLGDSDDKIDDFGALFTFIDNLEQNGGVWFHGMDFAEDWYGRTAASAVNLKNTFMSFDLVTGNHLPLYGFSPAVIGEPGSVFDHSLGPDTLVAFGGCPYLADFDVIRATGTAECLASYDGVGPNGGAVVGQYTTNSLGTDVGVMLSGFGYRFIRDDRPQGVTDRVHHLYDVLTWFSTVTTNPVGASPQGYTNTLAQNRPNPFNPVTTIEFTVADKGPVSLRVYNVAGQLVRKLVDDTRMPGVTHRIEWDGRNDRGQAVSSGVYFYKIVARDFTQTRKMVLLK
jgi:hypothetical protein